MEKVILLSKLNRYSNRPWYNRMCAFISICTCRLKSEWYPDVMTALEEDFGYLTMALASDDEDTVHLVGATPDRIAFAEGLDSEDYADAILMLLGNNKFLTMTGCKNLVKNDSKRSVQMKLPRTANCSRANYLTIQQTGDCSYLMHFLYFRPYRCSPRRVDGELVGIKERPEKREDIQIIPNVHGALLPVVFTAITGMDTHF